MSSAYGLFHVFNELLDEKANKNTTARGKTMGAKSEIYQGAWSALNAWIETKLAKQKGAGISGFGCFCWELKQKGDTTQCRPIFILSDAFVKNFRVRRERIHRLPETTPIEEVNYSLLAIKFSNSLTKDMVFSGLRDTIKKIGDFIDRGYEIEIAFTFGTLTAKERRVKFEFNQSRLLEILPDRIVPGTLGFGKAPTHLFDETESEPGSMSYRGSENGENIDQGSGAGGAETMLNQTARRVGTAPGKNRPVPSLLSLTRTSSAADATSFLDRIDEDVPAPSKHKIPSLAMGKLTLDTAPVPAPAIPEHNSPPPSAGAGDYRTSDDYNESDAQYVQGSPVPPDLRELLTTLSKKTTKAAKEEFRKQAKDRVLEQAYLRCLNSLESGAHQDDVTTDEAKQLLEEWKQKAAAQRAEKADQMKCLRASLDSQMSHNQKRAEDHKDEWRNSNTSFELPSESKLLDGKKPKFIANREAISKVLEVQIVKNADDRERARKESLNSERDYLNRLAMEIELHNAMDRSTHLEKQRALLEAWERDGHIRNLKKLQPFGVEPVQDYIQRNLASDPYATSTGPLNYTSSLRSTAPANTLAKSGSSGTLAGKLNMSIGYDPRKPKLEW